MVTDKAIDAMRTRRILKRIESSVAVGIKPYRRTREAWVCPNCGLNGDHMKVPISDKRCKGCCKTDAAEDLYQVLKNIERDGEYNDCPSCGADPGLGHRQDCQLAYAIAKAEGRL